MKHDILTGCIYIYVCVCVCIYIYTCIYTYIGLMNTKVRNWQSPSTVDFVSKLWVIWRSTVSEYGTKLFLVKATQESRGCVLDIQLWIYMLYQWYWALFTYRYSKLYIYIYIYIYIRRESHGNRWLVWFLCLMAYQLFLGYLMAKPFS